MDILTYINRMNQIYGNGPAPAPRYNTQQYLQGGRVGYQSGQLVDHGPGRQGYSGVEPGDTSRAQNRPTPMSKELAAWYEKNKATLLTDRKGNFKSERAWEKLAPEERVSVKSQFANRNNPKQINLKELEKLKDFLQKQKDAGRTLFKTVAEISKEAKVNLKNNAVVGVINRSFPNTFNYEGLDLNKAPGVLKRVKELAKTNTVSEMINILLDEKLIVSDNDVSIRKLMKDNNIPVKPATQELDNLVKTYVKKNPKITDINEVARNLEIEVNSLQASAKRLGIKNFTGLQDAILKDITALDKIVKNNLDIINDPKMSPTAKNNILQKSYLKATGKKFVDLSSGEFGSRLSRLGTLYAGEGRIKAFKNIKAPADYLNLSNSLQKNIIEMASKAKFMDNFTMGQMLGLPKNELKLIADTQKMMGAFDFSVAGDHTDIKSMMKDFSKYKQNFSRIEYVKNNLNLYKKKYDLQINALRKKAQQANNPETRLKFLNDAKKIQKDFATNTGYRIGTFDIKDNRVVLNPQTARLIDLKNPRNTALQTAMENFAKTSSPEIGQIAAATKEIFSSLDKKLMNSSVKERIEIFKKIQGTEAAKQSQYLKALSKLPKVGKIAKAIMVGTAATSAMTTLANADTLEPGDEKKEADVLPSVISEHPILSSAAAVTAAAPKKVLKGLKWAGEKLLPIMTPAVSHAFKLGEGEPYNPTSGHDLATMGFWNSAIKAMGKTSRWKNPKIGLVKKLKDLAWRGGIPTRFLPYISGTAAAAAGPMLIKDAADWLQGRLEKDNLTGKGGIADYAGIISDEAGGSLFIEDVIKEKQKQAAEGMDYATGGNVEYDNSLPDIFEEDK